MYNQIEDVENDINLPWNIEVDMCPDDAYNGIPYISVLHREEENDDTIIFSLEDGSIIDGELSNEEETEIMCEWVNENLDYLYQAWYNGEMKIIVQMGEPDVL